MGSRFRHLPLMLLALLALAAPLRATPDFDPAQYRGRVVWLDFWASWCAPCKLSFPYMRDLARRHGGDLAVVTVNLDRSRAAADAFLARAGTDLPVIYDNSGALARQYRVADMPTSVLIDRSGRVRFTHRGFHPSDTGEYEAHVRQLIQER